MKWEQIDSYTDRLWIPDGWIVRSKYYGYGGGAAIHQVVVHDPNHLWKIA